MYVNNSIDIAVQKLSLPGLRNNNFDGSEPSSNTIVRLGRKITRFTFLLRVLRGDVCVSCFVVVVVVFFSGLFIFVIPKVFRFGLDHTSDINIDIRRTLCLNVCCVHILT